jgi:sugar lactone lactonase YvrE
VGVHATNLRLLGVQQIDLHGEVGPEHVLIGPDGLLYTGVVSGRILRMQPDGSAQQVLAQTGGRPLGMVFDAAGNLIVADAIKGLLSIGTDGKVTLLADKADGVPMRFLDAVTMASNGKIYFTDASARFSPLPWGSTTEAAMLDVIEQSATGRVLEYDPATRAVRIVARGLSFANGIALSGDQCSVLVAETGRYRVWQIAVAANRLDLAQPSAQAKVLLDNLPGYPDNLLRGQDGKIWLGLAGQRNDLDRVAAYPFLRRVAMRLPRALWPVPRPYGHVLAFTEEGTVVADLQDPSGHSPLTTGLTETADRMFIHNADAGQLGWLPRQ